MIFLFVAFVAGVLLFARQLEKNEPIRQAVERAKRGAPITIAPSLPIARTHLDMPPALRTSSVDPLDVRRKRSPRSTARH